jgi:predicted metal-dependent phosphoesterase TrpH
MTHKNAEYVDLHIHSTASDGSLSPSQIIQEAKKAGLRAISITDHDTLDGTIEALGCPDLAPLEVISGIEMTANFPSGGMHILGYLFETDDVSLGQTLKIVQNARAERNSKITYKLKALGINIQYSDVLTIAGTGQVGRPHFAQALVLKGTVGNVDEAFNKFLKKGGPAYASRYRLEPAEAIEVITKAGGVPVLAHPSSLGAKREEKLDRILADLKNAGLKGLEVYYPEHDPEQESTYKRLALRNGLVMTGGTDFHGSIKPHIHMGIGKGHMRIPFELIDPLKACRPQRQHRSSGSTTVASES